MEKLILIKYGELTTKKGNRNVFIKLLVNNIKKILKDYNFEINYDRSRMYIQTDKPEEVAKKLKNVFGIHSIVICYKVQTNTEDIKNKVLNLLQKLSFNTFKIDTKRALKTFPITSMEVSKKVGAAVLKNIKGISFIFI